MALLDDIASHLVSKSIGTIGTDLFLGYMPDQPDNCVGVFEYAGEPMELTMGTGDAVLERPGLQVRARNKSYSAAKTKIDSVVTALHGLAEQTLNSKRYLLVRANQSPESIGMDQNNRSELVVNFSVLKER